MKVWPHRENLLNPVNCLQKKMAKIMESVAFSYLSGMHTHIKFLVVLIILVVLITSEGDNIYLINKLMPTADREDALTNQLLITLKCIFKSIV